jgi:uncharacterized damage-inducible protein DinB
MFMSISDLLLPEFDREMKTTRVMLERVPYDKKDFVPHPKSMPLEKLAQHVAMLAGLGATVLTTPTFDFNTKTPRPRPEFTESGLLAALDENAEKSRAALKNTSDAAWNENWTLSFEGKPIFTGTRFMAYRQMFMNHLVHHRAQLGVYLRMNDKPLPPSFGPSADEIAF